MSETPYLLLAFVGGTILGGIFFAGLRLTIRRGLASPRPALWFCCSYPVRMAIAVIGFTLISGGHWPRLLASLLGFVFIRSVMTRLANQCEPGDGAGDRPCN